MTGTRRRLLSAKSRASLAARLGSLEHRRLLYLHEAGSAGSVRAAAERLNTSASVLSRQIAKMEESLQIPLMERHGRGIRLTEAGELLVTYYNEQNDRMDAVVAQIHELTELRRGLVSIATGEGFVGELMDRPLREFARKHPQLRIDLQLGSTDELVRRIVEDVAHIGLLYNLPPEPRITSHRSVRHPMRVATAPDHPLALLGRKIELHDLQSHELGLLPGGYGVRQALLSAEHRGMVTLTPRLTANSSRVLLQYAEEWNGVILTPAFAITREIDEGRLVALETADTLLDGVEAHLVTRSGRRIPAAANQLIRHLKATLPLLRSQG